MATCSHCRADVKSLVFSVLKLPVARDDLFRLRPIRNSLSSGGTFRITILSSGENNRYIAFNYGVQPGTIG